MYNRLFKIPILKLLSSQYLKVILAKTKHNTTTKPNNQTSIKNDISYFFPPLSVAMTTKHSKTPIQNACL